MLAYFFSWLGRRIFLTWSKIIRIAPPPAPLHLHRHEHGEASQLDKAAQPVSRA
jgi:hypothetical protein